jgi:FlaA1/EpsC-like NDP-sugar epimerase
MSKNWIYLRIVHIGLDFLGVYVSFLLAYFLRVGWIFSTDFPFLPFAKIAFLATFFWIAFLTFAKYYRIPPRSGGRKYFDTTLVFVGGGVAIAFLLVFFFFKETFFSRLINTYTFVLGSSFLLFSQFVFRKLLARLKKSGKKIYRTLVVGANRVAERLIEAIEKNPYAPYKIIGVIDPYGLSKTIKYSKILGKLDKLEMLCDREKITAIIQCDAFEHTLNLISLCIEKDIKFQFDPALRGIFEENLRIREVAGINLISFAKRDFSGTKKLRYKFIDFLLRQIFDVD